MRAAIRDAFRGAMHSGMSGRGFLPSQLPGLKIWNRFNQGITETGLGVSQWDDASGNGNHLLQGTDANRPSKEANGSILFDGLAHFLAAAGFIWNQPETLVIIGKQITWAANDRICDGNTFNSLVIYQTGITPDLQVYAGVGFGPNSEWVLNTDAVLISVFNGASSLIQVDNGTPVTGNAGAANAGGFILGARQGGSANWSNIQVKEVIGYDVALNAAQIAQIATYGSTL